MSTKTNINLERVTHIHTRIEPSNDLGAVGMHQNNILENKEVRLYLHDIV